MSQSLIPIISHLASRLKDPDGFNEALAALDPSPVRVDEKREKRSKSKGSKKRKSKTSKAVKSKPPKEDSTKSNGKQPRSPSAHSNRAEPDVGAGDLLSTFTEAYQDIIRKLPMSLWPQAARHGNHSYTVFLVCILLE